MKEEKDRLSRSFKARLGDYSQEVNPSTWINLQAGIRRSKMLKLRYYYMSAASIVVLVGVLTGILIFSESPVSSVSLADNTTISVDNSSSTSVINPTVSITSTVSTTSATSAVITVVEPKQSQPRELLAVLDKKESESTIELRENSANNESLLSDVYPKEVSTESTEKKVTTPVKRNLPQTTPMTRESLWDIEEETLSMSRPRRKLGLSFMGAGSFVNNNSSMPQEILSTDMLGDVSQFNAESSDLSPSSFSQMERYMTSARDYEYRYNLPFSFGVSLRVDLPKGFSVETGVFATMLSTTFLREVESDKKIGSNAMWYIGIPIKANWSFFSSGVWSLYVSAGGAIEKCISSQYSGGKLYFQDLTVESSSDILAKDFAFQFSVNAAIGLQVKLADFVGLFFEPGAAYYFSAKSPIPTVRTDRPFNLSLQAGLRFSL